MAIETMLTFSMGLALAIGTIGIFDSYRTGIISTTTDKQVQVVESELRNSVFHLKSADSGYMEVQLPENIAGSDYSITLYNGTRINVNQQTFIQNFTELNQDYSFEGSTRGGTVNIYKSDDKFILRPG